jgi:hypothetical protein
VLTAVIASAMLLPRVFDYTFENGESVTILSSVIAGFVTLLALLGTFMIFRREQLDREFTRHESVLSRELDGIIQTLTSRSDAPVEGDPLRFSISDIEGILERANQQESTGEKSPRFDSTPFIHETLKLVEPAMRTRLWQVRILDGMVKTLRDQFRRAAALVAVTALFSLMSLPLVSKFDSHRFDGSLITGLVGLATWALWEVWSFIWQTTGPDRREQELDRLVTGRRGQRDDEERSETARREGSGGNT